MKFSERLLKYGPAMMFFLIILQLLTGWVFMRFVHYHAQYRVLPEGSYICKVFTAEDYEKLNDPNLYSVQLSNGSTIEDRQPVWFQRVLPQIKKINDDTYILVTTLGTAHYADRWLQDVLPLSGLAIFGLGFSLWGLRRSAIQKNV